MAPRILIILFAALLVASTSIWPGLAGRPVADPAEIRIEDPAAGSHLVHELPAVLRFDDRMGVAEVARLSAPFAVDGLEPMSRYRAGDLGYRASDRTLIVFLTDGSAVPDDVVFVGHVAAGFDRLAACTRDCDVRVEVAG